MKSNIRRTINRGQAFDWFYNKFSKDQLMQIYVEYYNDINGKSSERDLSKMGRCSLAAALEDLDSVSFKRQTRQ